MNATPAPKTRHNPRLQAAALVVLTVCITLALAELMLGVLVQGGILDPGSPLVLFIHNARGEGLFHGMHETPLFRPSVDPVLRWEPIPGATLEHIRINDDGFRGPAYDPRPAPGVVRVAVVGDSETMSVRLNEQDTLPGALESELNRLRQGQTRYEALNLGVPGYNSVQELRWYELKARRYQPSVVVLYYVLNDPEPGHPTWFMNRGVLWSSYLALFGAFISKSRLEPDEPAFSSAQDRTQWLHQPERFAACETAIRAMANLAHQDGARFVVVIAPELTGYTDLAHYPYKNIHARLRSLAAPGLEVVDGLPALPDHGDPHAFWVQPFDHHKDAEANHRVALLLAQHLLQAPPVP